MLDHTSKITKINMCDFNPWPNNELMRQNKLFSKANNNELPRSVFAELESNG